MDVEGLHLVPSIVAGLPAIRSRLRIMLTRRTFLEQTAALASASLILPLQTKPRYKMGLQLFTMRAAMTRDAAGALQRIAALGYEELETYGFDPQALGYYGMPAKAFAERLRELKLTTPSGHYDLNRFAGAPVADLTAYVARCIEGAHALGQSYITWPLVDEEFRTIDKLKVIAERLNTIGAQIKKAGLQLAYHNHDFEFVDQNGQIGYDVILKETDPALVKLQMDLYWIAHGSKLTPHEWFVKQPGRYVMWHVKDMHKVSRDYTELGNGSIDFTKIWPDTKLAGMKHFFVEQGGNFTKDPFQSITDSAAYVKTYLLK
jgi:sugar phosphate isomerase/epimerase